MAYRLERLTATGWAGLVVVATWAEAYRLASLYSAATGGWIPDPNGATSTPDWGWYAPPVSIVGHP